MPPRPTTPHVVQVGANAHSGAAAFAHDPVPYLITKGGWRATLVEPQPAAAAALRASYEANKDVDVLQAAFCADASMSSAPLYFINGSKTLGANESDVRCEPGGAISGTASFSKAQVLQHQRFYRFTPSQCSACAARLGRPLPPTCMKRIYTDNLDTLDVRCVRTSDLTAAHQRTIDALVVDAEGQDAVVVTRVLDDHRAALEAPPTVIVYEHVHLKAASRTRLGTRLVAAGLSPYRARAPNVFPEGLAWQSLRHVLKRVNTLDNSVWVVNKSAEAVVDWRREHRRSR